MVGDGRQILCVNSTAPRKGTCFVSKHKGHYADERRRKKMFHQIARKTAKRNPLPSGEAYKLRSMSFYFGDIRIIPSYIMTGENILIEKSKVSMTAEDIAIMAEIIK